jgi:hypothetical protein
VTLCTGRSDELVDLLDATQFSYNLQKSSMMGYSPFELMNGQQPTTPHFVTQGYYGMNPSVCGFCEELAGSVGDSSHTLD